MIVLRAVDNRTRIIAISGVLLGLAIALLYLKTLVPILDFSIYILISLFTGVIIQESNHGWAWLFFISSVLLSLILPVNKLSFLLFYSFFGYFGIIKFYIEKIKLKAAGFILKIVFINTAVILNYYIAASFLPGIFGDGIQLYLIMLVATAFVFIYDYIYTMVMVFYSGKLRKLIRRY